MAKEERYTLIGLFIALVIIGTPIIHCEWSKQNPEERMELYVDYEATITNMDVYGRFQSNAHYVLGLDNGRVINVSGSLWAILKEGDVIHVVIYRHQLLGNQQVLRLTKVN